MMMNPWAEHSDIEIFLLRQDAPLDETVFSFFLDKVQPEKRDEVLRQKIRKRRDMKLLSQIFSKLCIKKVFGIDFNNQIVSYSKFGKPYLLNHYDIHFNVSHSGDILVCAVSRTPVGIDVQKVSEFDDKLISRVCSESEAERVFKSVDKNLEFCRIWTQKEAYLKFLGTGIESLDLKDVLAYTDCRFKTLEYEDYIISVSY